MIMENSFYDTDPKFAYKDKNHRDRFLKINDLLAEYSLGNFEAKGEISTHQDEIDAIVKSINLLGEELQDRTISRNYFFNIFNSTRDMLFVLDENGLIQNANTTVEEITGLNFAELYLVPIKDLLPGKKFNHLFNKCVNHQSNYPQNEFDCALQIDDKTIPIKCKITKIEDDSFLRFLLIAEDISERVETEQIILRTIVNTQEKEQERLASDLHDSLGQELSAVKLFLTSLDENKDLGPEQLSSIIETCKNLLDKSISSLRAICYDLLPSSLENEGVLSALSELTDKLNNQNIIQFHYSFDNTIKINRTLGKNIFRIVQEFINNSLKYSSASNILIEVTKEKNGIEISLKDDGEGFNPKSIINAGKGISNMKTRTKAFDGKFDLTSIPGEGTRLRLFFPFNVIMEEDL